MEKRKQPLRKCTGCGQKKPKKELIRIVRTNNDDVLADFTGKINGRGAYLCPDIQCVDLAIESNQIARSLKKEVPSQVLKELKEKIDEDLKARRTP